MKKKATILHDIPHKNKPTSDFYNDVDFIFLYGSHGCNIFHLVVDGKRHVFFPTYLGSPLDALARCAVNLAMGSRKEEFIWLDEPGEYVWEIVSDSENSNILRFSIQIRDRNRKTIDHINFCVNRLFFLSISYAQLKKIQILIQIEEYSESRIGYEPFPDITFGGLEKLLQAEDWQEKVRLLSNRMQ